jgi:hypothetical protein
MRVLVTGARGKVGAGEELMDAAGLPVDHPDVSGLSCAKAARLRPEAGEPAAAGESGLQRGWRAIS